MTVVFNSTLGLGISLLINNFKYINSPQNQLLK